MRGKRLLPIVLALALAGCASIDPQAQQATPSSRTVTAFSLAEPDGTLPGSWQPWRLSKLKRLTSYQLVNYDGTVVVKALSAASASGLVHPLDLDPRDAPILQWRWKVPRLIPGADNARRSTEDAPVRVVLSFDGDIDSLPLEERMFFDRVHAVTGHRMPYATLMYIWENRAERGRVIQNPHTSRVQMIVAESGPARTGTWKLETQNVYEDYKRAFGKAPGRITSIAIMTDTDNTGETVEAFYGDIAFLTHAEYAQLSALDAPAAAQPAPLTASTDPASSQR
jgi:hypothetical protein